MLARIKLAYLGGGSTRAAGTMASLIENGADFAGSEVVLVDLDADRLELVRTLAERMAQVRGLDLTVRATTDRRAALEDGDAVLSSLPAGWVRGPRARRADPPEPRRDRAGDAGPRRVLHGAAGDRGAATGLRRDGAALPRRADLQLHQPGQHRRPGHRRAFSDRRGVAVRRADLSSSTTSPSWPSSIRESSKPPWSASTTAAGASSTATTAT